MNTKMISFMKHTKDRMNNPMPLDEIKQLVNLAKEIGATHCEVATVAGHQNFKAHSKMWADEIHNAGMKVTWRCAHVNMEGLYGQPKYVGAGRMPVQFWKDKSGDMIRDLQGVIRDGDEWSIYAERTEGIFQDATSWIWPNTPDNYANAFLAIHKGMENMIEKPAGLVLGLSANNASELLSGWMPKSLIDYAGVAVIDHYVDGNPTQFEADVRTIFAKYGSRVYVQEGATQRQLSSSTPFPTTQMITAYIDALKRLDTDGVLYGFGWWGGWSGAAECILNNTNGVWSLNAQGEALKAWWLATPSPVPTPVPVPTPIPVPTPVPTPTPTPTPTPSPIPPSIPINLMPLIAAKSMEVLRQASIIVFKSGTLTSRMNELKTLLSKVIE